MKSQYLLNQAIQFWKQSAQLDLGSKQDFFLQFIDPKLQTRFLSSNIDKQNQDHIIQAIRKSFQFFNDYQQNKKIKVQLEMDRFLQEKILLQLRLLNENQIKIKFPQNIISIEPFGELQVYGLNINRDENKYFNDYNYYLKDGNLIFDEKFLKTNQKKQNKQEINEQLKQTFKEDFKKLPFVNRQINNIFNFFGQKYEPKRESDFLDDISDNYKQFRSLMFNAQNDYIIIEDYIIKSDPILYNQEYLNNSFSFFLRSERLKYGKEPRSIIKFSEFKITDFDFLCAGNPPAYLKSYL